MNKAHYIIVTHGNLSVGFAHTIELLTHKNNLHALTAYDGEEFPENLISLMDTFINDDSVIIFTDLTCGSVTQKVMELYGSNPNLHLFSGVNLALILEIVLSEQALDDNYCQGVIQAAKDQICYLHGAIRTRE